MSDPRRPAWDPEVHAESPVVLELEGTTAFRSLAALHEAQRLLAAKGPEQAALREALLALERELGLAIGAERARSFLQRRAQRRRAAGG